MCKTGLASVCQSVFFIFPRPVAARPDATLMKKTIGILAHVDAGKTTFSEQVLFRMGALRSLGRVDHQDAFLDAHPIEKRRGITIFSDQAVFQAGEDT